MRPARLPAMSPTLAPSHRGVPITPVQQILRLSWGQSVVDPMNNVTPTNIRSRRTFIFSPGLNPDMYPKALASGTDIVCVELEDGIAPKDKDLARERALALFAEPQADDGVERAVRINCVCEAFGVADVQAVLATNTPPPVLMMPKGRTSDEVVWLDGLLTERGHETQLQVIIETNQALEAAYEIAHCSG